MEQRCERFMKICPGEKKRNGTSLVAPWLRLCLCNAGGEGSIPGWRIKILCTVLVQAYQPAPRPAHPSQPPKAPVSQYLLAVKILPPLLLLKLLQYSVTSTLEGGHMGTLTRVCVCVCVQTHPWDHCCLRRTDQETVQHFAPGHTCSKNCMQRANLAFALIL